MDKFVHPRMQKRSKKTNQKLTKGLVVDPNAAFLMADGVSLRIASIIFFFLNFYKTKMSISHLSQRNN